ncbi:MAG: type IV-A pilus assembly ATPase PilB [SAR86 cluster bacterium]|uniref:Type IV-A pilus assembly ATPase PilB n=1 Tax=SAR86 cluster bacterium TaxID=2030880 RepID=A0A2A4MHM2_9GAMM|nr:MAG: type IV-A pilus assembly ATPase PilB [SAR86 cluster bacterium]
MSSIISGLARRLVSDRLLEESQAVAALNQARKNGTPFVSHLVNNSLLDGHTIAIAAAEEFGAPLLDLSAYDLQHCPMDMIDPKLIKKHHVLPLYRRANRLFLAVSDPANIAAFDEIKFHTGISNDIIVVEEAQLAAAIEKFLENHEASTSSIDQFDDIDLEDFDIEVVTDEKPEEDLGANADEAPIVKFVNKLMLDAIRSGASDIHIEPYEKTYRVRFRTDGILKEVTRPPINIAARIASRIKIMSQMDISERRKPQDGRIKMKVSKTRAIDFRVNTLPTLWGEKIVLRILDPTSAQMGIDALGYEEVQKQQYLKALHRHQGLILVTGPTGSGKTVSLYTGLNILNTEERNISTAEDPVEINLEGINQVPVNNKIGLDFAACLRSFLRQDPDVIMVGEIRDLETAEIAIKASQTGHMVMSTLHTNSAAETLTRMRNMGVPSFNLASSVSLIIAQRLARRLCPHCKLEVEIPEDLLCKEGFEVEDIPHLKLFKAQGCDNCTNGYKGRVGIYEVVPITESMSRIIMADGNSIEIADQAKQEGFKNLRQSALMKVGQGLTSLEEANRIS